MPIVNEDRARITVSRADVDAARTPAGGWSKATLAEWGVRWPPPKGWLEELTTTGRLPDADAHAWPASTRADDRHVLVRRGQRSICRYCGRPYVRREDSCPTLVARGLRERDGAAELPEAGSEQRDSSTTGDR